MSDWQVSIGEKKAIELSESNWWDLCTHREIAEFQMFTAELCCPFSVFHEAVEKTLGRPVWTHEFGSVGSERMAKEIRGERAAPTIQEIMDIIPAEKRIVIQIPD